MEKQQGHFIIAEPCHEDWNKMKPESQGRFCDACQKCVVDFTQMSHHEMLDVYQKAGGNVCGRVTSDQLGNQKEEMQAIPTGTILSKLQKFALALLVAFGLVDLSTKAQNAQPIISISSLADFEGPIFVSGGLGYVHDASVVRGTVDFGSGKGEIITVTLRKDLMPDQVQYIKSKGEFKFENLKEGKYTVTARDNEGHFASETVNVDGGNTFDVFLSGESMILGQMVYFPEDLNSGGKCNEKPDVVESSAESAISKETRQVAILPPIPDLKIRLSPNPSAGRLHLRLNSEPVGPMSVLVYDLEGKIVHRQYLEGEKGSIWEIDLSEKASGTYLLEFRSGQARIREKILVMTKD
jgi:hypothetical protein